MLNIIMVIIIIIIIIITFDFFKDGDEALSEEELEV